MSGDVKVFGLMAGTFVIEDIGMDVPHGTTVTIPAVKAHVSKDLWRGISQRFLFRLTTGQPTATTAPAPNAELEMLREQVRALTEANARLQAEAAAPRAEDPTRKLDTILALLQSAPVPVEARPRAREPEPARADTVSGDVPMFIPSQIKPEGVDVQISTTPEESSGSAVSGAASALRKFRKGAGQ